MEEPTEPYTTANEDLARIVAQMTSGAKDAIPEQDDFDLAKKVVEFIEKELRDETPDEQIRRWFEEENQSIMATINRLRYESEHYIGLKEARDMVYKALGR